MRAKRVDGNQKGIIKALEKAGASVFDTSSVGRGFPDLVVAYRGKTYLVEVKNPDSYYGKRGFNKKQKEFLEGWKGSPVHLVATIEEALKTIGAVL